MNFVAVQTAIRAVLIASSQVTDLVPAEHVHDSRDEKDPQIVMGEDQIIEGDDIARRTNRLVSTLHVWKREPSTVGVKAIASAIRSALHATRPTPVGFQCGDCRVNNMRFLRDPDGETSHAVITVETLVRETPAVSDGVVVLPMPSWGAAKAGVLAGTRNAKLISLGDSTTGGAYSSVLSPAYQDARPGSWPSVLSGLIGANADSWLGNNSIGGVTVSVYNPLFVASTNWAGAANTIGGLCLRNLTDASPLSVTPSEQWDEVEVWTPQSTGLGTITIDVDGGPVTTISEVGSNAYIKTTVFAVGVGLHTVNIKRVSGSCFVGGLIFKNSAQKRINVCNSGSDGARVANFVVNGVPFDALPALKAHAPDLTIICLTINDANMDTATATFEANTQALISAAKLSGDVILMTGVPSKSTSTPLLRQQAKAASYRHLADLNGLNLIDMMALWGTWEAADANGWMANELHPNAAGYAQIAAAVSPYL